MVVAWPKYILAVLIFSFGKNGAIAQESRIFEADLAAEWQTKYTESPSSGAAQLSLDLETRTLTWNLNVEDLTGSALAISLHGPAQPGTNGRQIADLGPLSQAGRTSGSTSVTAAQIQYLLFGWTYINVTTATNPDGEIRGQVVLNPDPESL